MSQMGYKKSLLHWIALGSASLNLRDIAEC